MGINDKEIGQRMRERRIELGFSVTRVAMELNFTVEHYRMLETGTRKQTLATIAAFSELYHVSVDYLIHGMLNELIHYIEVHQAEKVDGVWEQKLTIHYNCVGVIDIPAELPLPAPAVSVNTKKDVTVSYAPNAMPI